MITLNSSPEKLYTAHRALQYIIDTDNIDELTVVLSAVYPDATENYNLVYTTLTGPNAINVERVVEKFFRDVIYAIDTPGFTWAYNDYRIAADYQASMMGVFSDEVKTAMRNVLTPGTAMYSDRTTPVLHLYAQEHETLTLPRYEGYPVGVSIAYHPEYNHELPWEDALIFNMNIAPSSMDMRLPFYMETGTEVTVDWGDGTTEVIAYNPADTVRYQVRHTYTGPQSTLVRVISTGTNFVRLLSWVSSSDATYGKSFKDSMTRIIQFGKRIYIDSFCECKSLVSVEVPFLEDNVTTGVQNSLGLFGGCSKLSYIPEDLFVNCPNVVDLKKAFYNCTALWDIPANVLSPLKKLRILDETFSYSGISSGTAQFIVESNTAVTSMKQTFAYCKRLGDVPVSTLLNQVNLEDATGIFRGANIVIYDPWLFKNCKSLKILSSAFQDCDGLTSAPDLFGGGTPLLESISNMFNGCKSMTSVFNGMFRYPMNIKSAAYAFANTAITTIPDGFLDSQAFGNCITISSMFRNCSELTTVPTRMFLGLGKVTDASYIFSGCGKLAFGRAGAGGDHSFEGLGACTTFEGALQNTATSAPYTFMFPLCRDLKNVSYMFDGCKQLTVVPTNLDTTAPNVENFSYTFRGCTALTDIPEDYFSLMPNANNFMDTFNGSGLTAIRASMFNTPTKITNLTRCFYGTKITEIPQGLFSTQESGYMTGNKIDQLFESCTLLTTFPADLFPPAFRGITSMTRVFRGCVGLQSIPATQFGSSMPNLTSIQYMFNGCTSLRDIPQALLWTSSSLTNVEGMFQGCTSLEGIPDALFQATTRITRFNYCFDGCTAVSGATPKQPSYTELWNRAGNTGFPANVNGQYCFRGCTGLSNYASIPDTWK